MGLSWREKGISQCLIIVRLHAPKAVRQELVLPALGNSVGREVALHIFTATASINCPKAPLSVGGQPYSAVLDICKRSSEGDSAVSAEAQKASA